MAVERQDMEPDALPAGAYRALVEAALDIIAVLDSEGRIRFINGAVTRLLGYRPADIVGKPVQDFYHPEDRARAMERLARTIEERDAGAQTEVYRLRHSDGSYRQLESLAVSRLDDPEAGGIYLVARDVTDRLAAEAERVVVQARRQLAVRVARLGIWEWNTQTGELIADEPVRELVRQGPDQRWTGPEEFVQRFLPADRGALGQALRDAANGKESGGLVVRMPLPDHSLRWLYLHAQPMHTKDSPNPWVLGLLMDITGQKRAEQEMASRGELLELAAWGAGIGTWTWFPARNCSILNERCVQLLGLPAGGLERTTAECNEPVHPDDLPELQRLEADTVAGKTDMFDCAYRVRANDSGWRWIMDRGRVSERDESGQAVRVSGVTLDIDEAKRREHELNDQRLRLDLALDASQLGTWDFDVVSNDLLVDERYAGIVGLSAAALRRDNVEFVRRIHEEDRPRLLAAAGECLEGRTGTLRFEGRLLRPDGRLIWIQVEGFVARRQPDGLPARMVGTMADVTERRREDQLDRAGERVANLGSYELDVATGRFHWSEGSYRIFDLSGSFTPTQEAIGGLFPPSQGAIVLDAFRAAREEGRDFDIEVEALAGPGRRRWVRMIGRVESFRDRPARVFGIMQDVSERRMLEAELLEAANREQQKLGRDLHDGLGQELTGIALLLQGLGQRVKAANPSLARPFDRVSTLLSAAIRSTRSLAHGLAPVSVGRSGLEGALRTLSEQATASHSVSVTFEVDPGKTPSFGEVAGNHIYRIVQEALSNAIRHGRAKTIRIRLSTTAIGCLLDITDDGCGIDPQAAPGNGLGLRSMNYRAQAIGGTLSIERVPGGGTRVRLSCPQPAA